MSEPDGASRADVPTNVEISAVITRADGTVEDLGVIYAQHKNPLKQAAWNLVGRRLSHRRIKRANAGVKE